VKPFLNWAGGKRWFVANHSNLLPQSPQRLIEPFLGSGAVFFHVQPASALLSDANAQLIETYVAVRDEPAAVFDALRVYDARHSEQHYYLVRSAIPETPAERAARFIYLNRTCFNGLFRVNRKGEFNVPIGSKTSVIRPDDDFAAWGKRLQGTVLVAQDFAESIAAARQGDVVYADPPYTVKHNTNNFVKYNEQIFSWQDQVRLAKCLCEATRRGVRVIASNADSQSVRGLYRGSGWVVVRLSRQARLAASSANRRRTTEIVLSNCLTSDGQQVAPRQCDSAD
jgi:DNA adenine methylase